SRFFFLLKTLFSLKKGSTVVFLFPVYARMNQALLTRLSKKKDIHSICFIADINGIKDGDEGVLKKEIEFFRRFRYFIVHNEKMKEWLLKNVSPVAVTVMIGCFDFLTTPVIRPRIISYAIVFAGNLEKSSFLEKVQLLYTSNPLLQFHVYGTGATDAVLSQRNITWHGVEKPYELPGKLHGSFGLIWDGTGIDAPAGSHGIYMEYISHHKLSLYIISGLPIIVPVKSAAALMVDKYQIGFTINNLYEIEGKINKLSQLEYSQMQQNMRPVAEKISKGQCLGNAIDEILEELQSVR